MTSAPCSSPSATYELRVARRRHYGVFVDVFLRVKTCVPTDYPVDAPRNKFEQWLTTTCGLSLARVVGSKEEVTKPDVHRVSGCTTRTQLMHTRCQAVASQRLSQVGGGFCCCLLLSYGIRSRSVSARCRSPLSAFKKCQTYLQLPFSSLFCSLFPILQKHLADLGWPRQLVSHDRLRPPLPLLVINGRD